MGGIFSRILLRRGIDKAKWHPVVVKVFEFEEAKEAFYYLKINFITYQWSETNGRVRSISEKLSFVFRTRILHLIRHKSVFRV